MKYIDYKWWFVRRNDDGKITEVAVRFYEGDYQDILDEKTNELVSTYVRSKKLNVEDLPLDLKGKGSTDSASKYVRLYTTKDFGDISTDDELRDFCNLELAKNKNGTTISEQTIT